MSLFRKKIIYLVRHGQSANNALNKRQGEAGGLSDKGKEQARFVGERFKNAKIQVLLVSPYERTKETAAIINESLKKPIEYINLLKERKNPSEIIGKDADSPEVKAIMDKIDRSFHDSSLRYSDEENFEDLKKRARVLLDYLSTRKEKRIMCVSHRIFLKMVLSYIAQGESLDSHEFVVLDYNTKVENTGVAMCTYTPIKKWLLNKNPWEILAEDYGRLVD
jgi:probable phosphoglycerate mutase